MRPSYTPRWKAHDRMRQAQAVTNESAKGPHYG